MTRYSKKSNKRKKGRFFKKGGEMKYPGSGQLLGKVMNSLGSGPRGPIFRVQNFADGTEVSCSLAGVLRKTRLNPKDTVMYESMGGEKSTYQIIFIYSSDQAKNLKKDGYMKSLVTKPVVEESYSIGTADKDEHEVVQEIDEDFISSI